MRERFVFTASPWLAVTLLSASAVCAGQPSIAGAGRAAAGITSPPKTRVLPRTPDGRPDLQGVWNFRTATPLERPAEFAGREFLTDEDVARVEQRARDVLRNGRPDGLLMNTAPPYLDYGTRVVGSRRSSLIVDPPDGRRPAMTPEAAKRWADLLAARVDPRGPESLDPWERCITRGLPAVMLPSAANNYLEIVQTPRYISILTEMIHEARIVPLDRRAFPPREVRAWIGYSRGHWEGDSLLIETRNFAEHADFSNLLGSGGQLRLLERFTRVDADTIDYRFTIEDPTTWTRPWTVAVPLSKTADLMYEYACHEGNYSLPNTLSAARAQQKP